MINELQVLLESAVDARELVLIGLVEIENDLLDIFLLTLHIEVRLIDVNTLEPLTRVLYEIQN